MEEPGLECFLHQQLFYQKAPCDKDSPTLKIGKECAQQVKEILIADHLVIVLYILQILNDQEDRPHGVESKNSVVNSGLCLQRQYFRFSLCEETRYA